jgi:hypothetical protein
VPGDFGAVEQRQKQWRKIADREKADLRGQHVEGKVALGSCVLQHDCPSIRDQRRKVAPSDGSREDKGRIGDVTDEVSANENDAARRHCEPGHKLHSSHRRRLNEASDP